MEEDVRKQPQDHGRHDDGRQQARRHRRSRAGPPPAQDQERLLVGVSYAKKNMNSTSAQNHHCSTSPWSIPGYRIFPQGSTIVKEYRRIE